MRSTAPLDYCEDRIARSGITIKHKGTTDGLSIVTHFTQTM
jgi:hypothetical protein